MLQPSRFPKDHLLRVPEGINFFNQQKAIRVHLRNLPHWRQDGATYFVTYRQFDSIPRAVWERMNLEAVQWNQRIEHAMKANGDLPAPIDENWESFQRSQWIEAERIADECHGSCLLADSVTRKIMVDALKFFEGVRHIMHAFVVMPNHVHLLVTPMLGWSLEKLTQSWKGFTAREINTHLGRAEPLWQQESFDRIVRDPAHFERILRYIVNNPKKARMGMDRTTVCIAENCFGTSSEGLREDPPVVDGDEW
jgi:REP element-mobilizing transposase RayT